MMSLLFWGQGASQVSAFWRVEVLASLFKFSWHLLNEVDSQPFPHCLFFHQRRTQCHHPQLYNQMPGTEAIKKFLPWA